jgi:hypothetical protein
MGPQLVIYKRRERERERERERKWVALFLGLWGQL